MGNKSKRMHWRDGIRLNETKHGTCEHQMLDGKCVRCEQKDPKAEVKKGERVKIEKAKKKEPR
jgi:hypothetical protein